MLTKLFITILAGVFAWSPIAQAPASVKLYIFDCGTLKSGNPDVLLAGLWDFRRQGWTFRSGGPTPTSVSGSGLYKSTDGGEHWTELTAQNAKGLPDKPYHLVVARNVLDPTEIKYFVSNAPVETSVQTMLLVAFSR